MSRSLGFLVLMAMVPLNLAVMDVADQNNGDVLGELEVGISDGNETQDGVPVGRTLFLLHLLKQKLHKFHTLDRVTTTQLPFLGCLCVPFYLCDINGNIINDGSGVLDLRYRRCTGDLEVCCFLRANPVPPVTVPTTSTPSTIPTTKPTMPTVPTVPPPPSTIPTTAPPPPPPTTKPTPSTVPTTAPPPVTIPIPQPTTLQPIQFPICTCVPIYQCQNYGVGGFDPRQQFPNTCVGAFVCCGLVGAPVQPTTFPPFTLPTTTTTIAPPLPVLPPIQFGQSCICTLLSACTLGYIPFNNLIDPRLILGRQGQPAGTCGPNSMCCKLTQNSPIGPQLNSANSPPESTTAAPAAVIKNQGTADACACIPMAQCAEGNAVTYDGIGAIDPRFGPCASATLVCCRLQNRQRTDVVVGLPSIQSPSYAIPAAIVNAPTVPTANICGARDTTYASVSVAGSTHFAEFPWMALLIVRRPGVNDNILCGGSLINSRTVLTAAHCVISCDPGSLIVRLGEWNTLVATEPLPYQEFTTQAIVIHPQFYNPALYHDVALVILSKPVTYAIHIRPACLPAQGQVYAPGTLCFASGWGRTSFGDGGMYQFTLHKVDLPIVDNANCQNSLRMTRLTQTFQLHPSFICAGGVANKDTCYKDGGGPLVCLNPATGRFTQVGIVSWGIGCGSNTPAVYASVPYHRQWIDQQVAAYGIS